MFESIESVIISKKLPNILFANYYSMIDSFILKVLFKSGSTSKLPPVVKEVKNT